MNIFRPFRELTSVIYSKDLSGSNFAYAKGYPVCASRLQQLVRDMPSPLLKGLPARVANISISCMRHHVCRAHLEEAKSKPSPELITALKVSVGVHDRHREICDSGMTTFQNTALHLDT
jgi:hypothetical protein